MLKVTLDNPNWLQLAYETLDTGGIVLHPTSTSYGLAVDALNEDAVERLNNICNRHDKPYIVLVKDIEDAKKYAHVNKTAKKLMEKYWPGPLTIVLNKKDSILDIVTAGQETIALRQDSHEVTKAISNAYARPYTSTSANPSGGKTPYSIEEALEQFDEGDIDLVIDVGELPPTTPSTIVDCSSTKPKILRTGAIAI